MQTTHIVPAAHPTLTEHEQRILAAFEGHPPRSPLRLGTVLRACHLAPRAARAAIAAQAPR